MKNELFLSVLFCAAVVLLCRVVKTHCKKILIRENCLL